jgi:hypothetical protein
VATNSPIKHILTSDDVLPAEGVQALVDSFDNSVDVLNEQHDTAGGLGFVHGGAPQALIAVAGVTLNDCLVDTERDPTPYWTTGWGPNVSSVFGGFLPDGIGLNLWVEVAHGVPTSAVAFMRSTLDPTAGVGLTRSAKWDALVPTCSVYKQGLKAGFKYVRVCFPNMGANSNYLGDVTHALVLVHGTPG